MDELLTGPVHKLTHQDKVGPTQIVPALITTKRMSHPVVVIRTVVLKET